MPHFTLQLLLLLLLAFMVGCVLGCLIRSGLGTKKTAPVAAAAQNIAAPEAWSEAAMPAEQSPAAGSGDKTAVETKTVPKEEVALVETSVTARPTTSDSKAAASRKPAKKSAKPVSTGKPARPKGLPKARSGKPDKLQMISGVGPKLEKTLHGLGYFHFDQIAGWGEDEVAWVDEHLRYKGRIERDEWIAQCKLLANGDMEQFNKLYGSGRERTGSTARKPPNKAT